MDHTNEQQKILEQKRQEIAEQVRGRRFVILYKKSCCRTFVKHCVREIAIKFSQVSIFEKKGEGLVSYLLFFEL